MEGKINKLMWQFTDQKPNGRKVKRYCIVELRSNWGGSDQKLYTIAQQDLKDRGVKLKGTLTPLNKRYPKVSSKQLYGKYTLVHAAVQELENGNDIRVVAT